MCRAVTLPTVSGATPRAARPQRLPGFALPQKPDTALSAELTHKRDWLDGQNVSATARQCLPGEILRSSFRLLSVFKGLERIYINASKPCISRNE